MNPAAQALRPFLSHLQAWVPMIAKSAYCQSVSICLVDSGLEVTAVWKDGSCKKVFTNQELLGHTSSLPAQSWSVPKRPCFWARQIIGAILNQRGV